MKLRRRIILVISLEQNGEKRQMSRRFVLCMGTALLLGILVAAKEPLWMLAVGLAVLVATNYNQKCLFTQKIVRSIVLLAFFCLGAGFFCTQSAVVSENTEDSGGEQYCFTRTDIQKREKRRAVSLLSEKGDEMESGNRKRSNSQR